MNDAETKNVKHKPDTHLPRTRHLDENGSPLFTNHLIHESSPYLLQHAHNPVDWYPWGKEALLKDGVKVGWTEHEHHSQHDEEHGEHDRQHETGQEAAGPSKPAGHGALQG